MRRRICACTYCAGEPWSVDVSAFSLTALLSAALGPSSLIRKQSFPSVRLHSNHERRGADGRRRFDFRPLGGQVFFLSYSCVIYIEKKGERERKREEKEKVGSKILWAHLSPATRWKRLTCGAKRWCEPTRLLLLLIALPPPNENEKNSGLLSLSLWAFVTLSLHSNSLYINIKY